MTQFIEVGPADGLTKFVAKTLPRTEVRAVNNDRDAEELAYATRSEKIAPHAIGSRPVPVLRLVEDMSREAESMRAWRS